MPDTILPQSELRELRRLCSNPLIELGSTLRPKHLVCVQGHTVSHDSTLVLRFPSNESANSWNKMHEDRIRVGGHVVTVALAVAVWVSAGSAKAAIIAGGSASILKDEAQATVWYPKVARGWSISRKFRFRYQQFPHQYLNVRLTDLIFDERGEERDQQVYGSTRVQVGGPFGIPPDVAERLINDLPDFEEHEFAGLT